MNKPKVSILMATYNNANYVTEAIQSILDQTFNDWEFIIVNDGSTDSTLETIKQIAKEDNRIIILNNESNSGVIKSLNKGLKVAKGEYVAKIDGDDVWTHREKLEKQVDFLENNLNYSLVGTWSRIVDRERKHLENMTGPSSDEDIRKIILKYNCFNHSSIVIRKSTLDKVGYYDENRNLCEDYELWLRIGKVAKIFNIPEFWVDYRVNPNSITQTKFDECDVDMNAIKDQYQNDYNLSMWDKIIERARRYYPLWFKHLTYKLKRRTAIIIFKVAKK
jgi:glycosyltransferase involved in cell wall biosynthesis